MSRRSSTNEEQIDLFAQSSGIKKNRPRSLATELDSFVLLCRVIQSDAEVKENGYT